VAKVYGEDCAADIRINRFKLDEECESHASAYYYYAEQYAEARKERDAAKDKLDLVLGQRETHIRRNPPDDMKVTEAVVTALLAQDTDVLAAREALRIAQGKVDVLYAATSAFEHRRSQLDNLVYIWSKEYYSNGGNNQRADSDSLRSKLNKGKEE